jgi:hypothetical protein
MHGAHRLPVIGRRLSRACIAMLAILLASAPGRADPHVAQLTRMLHSGSDKTRLSAVLALAKLGDPAAEKPLITALHDPSVRVRGVAVTALGRLGCEAALPSLRTLASDDPDEDVRKAASNAAMKIAQAHVRDHARLEADVEARRAAPRAGGAGGGGHLAASVVAPAPDLVGPHPDLYVLINSSSDDSPGTADKATRRLHADIIKRVLLQQCHGEASVTQVADDAERWGLAARHIDLSVTRLDVGKTLDHIEIAAQLRLAISDDSGKMMSFLSGGAMVQVSNQTFDARYLPALRRQALETAMRGMFEKLLAHLRDQVPRPGLD